MAHCQVVLFINSRNASFQTLRQIQKGGQQTPVTPQPQLKDGHPPTPYNRTFKREHWIIWINQTDKLGSLIRGGTDKVGGSGSRHSRFLQLREAANMENSMGDT